MKPKLGLLDIGTEVMRQFDAGLVLGTVLVFNSKDGLYKIEYSDGDREDMDEDEYIYAYQLALANGEDANDLSSRDSADEESAYVLPKVNPLCTLSFCDILFIISLLNRNRRIRLNVKSGKERTSLLRADAPNWRSVLSKPLNKNV